MKNLVPPSRFVSRDFCFIICALSFVIALCPAFFSAPVDSDLWWQLRVGLDMLRAGQLLDQDPYSYASLQNEWINHEWLAQIILAKAYQLGGNTGLSLLRGTLLSSILLLLFTCGISLWRGGITPITIYLLGFVLPITNFYLNLRPRGFAFVFLILLASLHLLYKRGFKKALWFFPVILVFFANVHGAFLLGLIFCLCSLGSLYLCNDSLDCNPPQTSERRKILWIFTLCIFAPLINPYGVDLFYFSFAELGTQHPNISEWQALNVQQLPAFLLLFILIGLSLLLSPRKLDQPTLCVFFVATAYLALKHNRFFILFVFFSSLLLFSRMQAVWRIFAGAESGEISKICKSWQALLLLCLLLLPFSYLQINKALSAPSSILVDLKRYPVQAVEFLKQNQLGPRLGIQFDWGGYALWHLHPKYQVSIDGRYASVYGSAYADQQITSYMNGDLSTFNGEGLMHSILVARGSALESSLLDSREWVKVFSDPVAAVFAPEQGKDRDPVQLETLPRYEVFP